MNEQRHIELDQRGVERIERWIVERAAEVSADIRADHAEIFDRAAGLVYGERNVLHGYRRARGEAFAMHGYLRRQAIVVDAAEFARQRRLDEMKIGERVGRQDLEVDAGAIHRGDAQVDVHERAAAIAHAMQFIVADTKARLFFIAKFRAVAAGRAHGRFKHRVGVHVYAGGGGETHGVVPEA